MPVVPSDAEAFKQIRVALCLVTRHARVLICKRPAHVELPGYWELPGGKIHPGESAEAAAVRELSEETGLVAIAIGRLPAVTHDYAHARVQLIPVICHASSGDPHPIAGDECRWVNVEELPRYRFPEANTSLSEWVRLAISQSSPEKASLPKPGD